MYANSSSPNFLIIGGQKCGTSWLHFHLRQHPDIFMPGNKETNYWWDHQMLPETYTSLFSGHNKIMSGEASPSYALLTTEQISKVKEYNPKMKAVFVLRNIFLCSWSALNLGFFFRRDKLEEAPDAQLLELLDDEKFDHFNDYERTIRAWRSVLGAENLLVVNHDLLKTDPTEFLSQCTDFLGVKRWQWDDQILREHVCSYGHVAGSGIPASPPIRKSLIPFLVQRYASRVKNLSEYLGQDLTHWIKEVEEYGS